jgi:hypothetical protein
MTIYWALTVCLALGKTGGAAEKTPHRSSWLKCLWQEGAGGEGCGGWERGRSLDRDPKNAGENQVWVQLQK